MGIFFAILTAPFFGGAVLGVRFCWLYGPGIFFGKVNDSIIALLNRICFYKCTHVIIEGSPF